MNNILVCEEAIENNFKLLRDSHPGTTLWDGVWPQRQQDIDPRRYVCAVVNDSFRWYTTLNLVNMSVFAPTLVMEAVPSFWVLAGTAALCLVGFQLARAIRLAFFSPLSRVPGPLICKLSGAVDIYMGILGGRRAEWMHGLHQIYGRLPLRGDTRSLLTFIA